MKKRINPISYLGWLGIVGVIGINTGDFMLQLFLIYFIFLTYRNMPADELFWLNIRKSATRAFILEIILNSVMIILITILEKYNISSAIRISIIKEFREQNKMSQTELAQLVGVRRETIGHLENGHYNPSLVLAAKIAKVFNVTIEDMFIIIDE